MAKFEKKHRAPSVLSLQVLIASRSLLAIKQMFRLIRSRNNKQYWEPVTRAEIHTGWGIDKKNIDAIQNLLNRKRGKD